MAFLDIFKIKKIKEENKKLNDEIKRLNSILTPDILAVANLKELQEDLNNKINILNSSILERNGEIESILKQIEKRKEELADVDKKVAKSITKTENLVLIYNAIKLYIEKFRSSEFYDDETRKINRYIEDIDIDDLMSPTAEVKLHNSDIKDLKTQFKQIDRIIDSTLKDYEKRYTTKSNLAIYRLMVVAMRSELQNVLYTMKYGKFENAETQINEIANKYLKIAADGNQTIAPTMTKFIVETKSLFIDAAKVEYEYYLRKERMKEEQKALREQMKQEAEEQKRLAEEQKKVEAEERKYDSEIEKLESQIVDSNFENCEQITNRINELKKLKEEIKEKKEAIIKLQNGKAGCVYVISNLGAFGDQVFKIGMTRRFNPQDRIDELGSASVPFSFDVHSFIFSEDASSLETQIHHRLNNNRVNKVNLRKEFFNISIDELESLVYELDPSAEFNKTMAAEQYRQSLSMTSEFEDFEEDEIQDDE